MKTSALTSFLTLGAFLAPVLAAPMVPQRVEYYESLRQKRQGPASLLELALGVFLEIAAENGGGLVISDIINAIATTFDPAGPKSPWVCTSRLRSW
jgi:hypothetical protein